MKVWNNLMLVSMGVIIGTFPSLVGLMVFLSDYALLITMLSTIIFTVSIGKKFLRKPVSKRTTILMMVFALFIFLFLIIFGKDFIILIESGFNDGPFYGVKYDGDISDLEVQSKIKYKDKDLLICYKDGWPILSLVRKHNDVIWSVWLKTPQEDIYKDIYIREITLNKVKRGLLRDKICFFVDWTFGHENGYAYIWKNGEFNRFYLSW